MHRLEFCPRPKMDITEVTPAALPVFPSHAYASKAMSGPLSSHPRANRSHDKAWRPFPRPWSWPAFLRELRLVDPFLLLYRRGPQNRNVLLQKTALFALWGIVVGVGIYHHVFWRDEVRALSIALQGDNLIEMFRAGQGEGHPFIWYIILRSA